MQQLGTAGRTVEIGCTKETRWKSDQSNYEITPTESYVNSTRTYSFIYLLLLLLLYICEVKNRLQENTKLK